MRWLKLIRLHLLLSCSSNDRRQTTVNSQLKPTDSMTSHSRRWERKSNFHDNYAKCFYDRFILISIRCSFRRTRFAIKSNICNWKVLSTEKNLAHFIFASFCKCRSVKCSSSPTRRPWAMLEWQRARSRSDKKIKFRKHERVDCLSSTTASSTVNKIQVAAAAAVLLPLHPIRRGHLPHISRKALVIR